MYFYLLVIRVYTLRLYELAQIEYALNLSEPISLGIVRHHNKEIWRACSISKNGEMSENGHAQMPIFGQNSISRTEGLRELILVPKCLQ